MYNYTGWYINDSFISLAVVIRYWHQCHTLFWSWKIAENVDNKNEYLKPYRIDTRLPALDYRNSLVSFPFSKHMIKRRANMCSLYFLRIERNGRAFAWIWRKKNRMKNKTERWISRYFFGLSLQMFTKQLKNFRTQHGTPRYIKTI